MKGLKWWRRTRVEQELDEELRYHVERQAELHERAGMSAEEARRRARLEFGGVESVKEECRAVSGVALAESVAQDVRYAVRTLARSPGFTAVAVLSLAAGIGANTALFSMMDAVLWETMPVREPARLVQAYTDFGGVRGGDGVRAAAWEEIRQARASFSGLFAFNWAEMSLRGVGPADRIRALGVTGEYFSTLGVGAALGRVLTREDNAAAVLSYGFWERRFGKDPGVLGKTVYLERRPLTIVGVTPPEFFGPDRGYAPDMTVPLEERMIPQWLLVWGRLKPGVRVEAAQAEFAAAFGRHVERRRAEVAGWPERTRRAALAERVELRPAEHGAGGARARMEQPLRVLLAFSGVVLLIACANLANLLLARAAARESEIGLRLAIGAGRRRLVRQLLTESATLAAAGAAAGLCVAVWAERALIAIFGLSEGPGFRLNPRVLGFTAAVAVATGMLFGIAPALRATHAGVRRVRNRFGRSLVVAQVAAAVVLLVGAGLFARTLYNLRTLDAGFQDPEHLLTMTLDARGPRMTERYQEIVRRVQALPGVKRAAFGSNLLFGRSTWWQTIWVEGYDHPANDNQQVGANAVGPGFFATAGIPLIAGREFTDEDRVGAPPVAIINERVARKYFPQGNAVGRRLWVPRDGRRWEIVGVVGDARYGSLRDAAPQMEYLSLLQDRPREAVLHVRTEQEPGRMARRIREEIAAVDPDVPVYEVHTLAWQVERTLQRERAFAGLSGFFGLLALGLTCVGLYGLISYGVARRTREIGVRMALGAARAAVVWMVLRETLALVVCGAAIGVPAALACTRLIRGLLFGLKPGDPATVIGATLALALVGALAGYLPARRAARMDATAALRVE